MKQTYITDKERNRMKENAITENLRFHVDFTNIYFIYDAFTYTYI